MEPPAPAQEVSRKRGRGEGGGKRSRTVSQGPKAGDVRRYVRGEAPSKALKGATNDKRLFREAKVATQQASKAAKSAAAAEVLLSEEAGFLEAEGPMERTYKVSQSALKAEVPLAAAKKATDLALAQGPYKCAYSRSGTHMLLGGRRGHVAVMDWNKLSVVTEFNVGERVEDATFLHNSTLFALAQAKYVHIYDGGGAEVHVLRGHIEPLALEFLPYHFLLASIGAPGFLKYHDVSTGSLVAQHRTRLGPASVLRANPWNAVLCAGHGGGAVTMWTPNMSTPVAKLAAHRGAVTALAVDAGGRYLVSAGGDSRVKVWDIRRWGEVHDYFSPVPAHALDVSQRGCVAVGAGSHVQVWGRDFALEDGLGSIHAPPKAVGGVGVGVGGAGGGGDASASGGGVQERFERRAAAVASAGVIKARSPYMRHELPGRIITTARFRPYDDLLAIGHSGGVTTLLVPGAGEPNFDSLAAGGDPYAGKKARQEAEVASLLDKIPATMISLDPSKVGGLDHAPKVVREKEAREKTAAAAAVAAEKLLEVKGKKRRGIRKMLKRAANVVTEQRLALEAKVKERAADRAAAAAAAAAATAGSAGEGGSGGGGGGGGGRGADVPARPKSALTRFYD